MNYRTVSSRNIIETVFSRYRNYISQDSDALLGNSIEWMGEALEAIGILSAMEDIDKTFVVSNGRVSLPCNLYLIKSVSYGGEWLPYGSQTFNYDLHCDNCVNETQASNLPYSYIINPNWLQTNVPDDEHICISYKAFAVDVEGFPQIPDKVTVKQALFWYITMMLCLGGFQHPEINFDKAEERWVKYCGQAEADLALLDKPQRESFKNQWIRLISTTQIDYRNFFSNNEGEVLQQRYNIKRV